MFIKIHNIHETIYGTILIVTSHVNNSTIPLNQYTSHMASLDLLWVDLTYKVRLVEPMNVTNGKSRVRVNTRLTLQSLTQLLLSYTCTTRLVTNY